MKKLSLSLTIMLIAASSIAAGGHSLAAFSPSSSHILRMLRLRAAVKTDQPEYALGQPVSIIFEVTNPWTRPVRVDFSDNQGFDVIVKNSFGFPIWQLSSDQSYSSALSSIELGPGETERFQIQWDQKDIHGLSVPAGLYTVRAFLTAASGRVSCSDSTQIRIRPQEASNAYIQDYQNSGCNVREAGRLAEEERDKFSAEWRDGLLYLYHQNATYNCCIEEIAITMNMGDRIIWIYEEEILKDDGCRCMCSYDLTATVAGLSAGVYTVRFYNKKTKRFLGEIPIVVVPWASQP